MKKTKRTARNRYFFEGWESNLIWLQTSFSDFCYRSKDKYDADFWGDFNVIPLEEELGKIIEKVSLKIEQTEAP